MLRLKLTDAAVSTHIFRCEDVAMKCYEHCRYHAHVLTDMLTKCQIMAIGGIVDGPREAIHALI